PIRKGGAPRQPGRHSCLPSQGGWVLAGWSHEERRLMEPTKREPGGGTDAGARLLAHKDRLLDAWVARIRQVIAPAAGEWEPILIDTLPVYLRRLAEALLPAHPRTLASEGNTVPEEHGGERARLTRYGPEHLIQEYQVLRDVLLEVLS